MDTPTALGEHTLMALGIGALCAVLATVTTQRQRVEREFARERERDRRSRAVQRWREAQLRTKPVLVNAPATHGVTATPPGRSRRSAWTAGCPATRSASGRARR